MEPGRGDGNRIREVNAGRWVLKWCSGQDQQAVDNAKGGQG
jgi:hypothetical protein